MKLSKQDILANVDYIKNTEEKVGHNTYQYIDKITNNLKCRYCYTDIITFTPLGLILNSDGYRTVTTKKKINEFQDFVHIYQKNFTWFVSFKNDNRPDVPFVDRMDILY